MAELIDLTWNWNNGTIKQALAELPEKFDKAGMEAINEGADFIVMMAKAIVHVDTGTLQKSIRKERGGKGKTWRVVRVRAGGYYINRKTGKICDYATHHEYAFPYMRPAVHTGRKYIVDLIRQKVVEEVKS